MTRENTHFVLGPVPLLLLAQAPIHDGLPVLDAPGGAMPSCPEWRIMPRLTMSVVDGPGDAGCLVQGARSQEEAADMARWCGAVEQAGGAVVVSLDSFDALPEEIDWDELFTDGRSRGGFVAMA
ncbi:hypothetical protein ACFYXS_23680 [Streptomyces sp. NPDC002574]|uniref:hypothetical protein n=1 Tax=Streptomyces sp. NPDC002574 TaxID=3364652 RepID=UPI00369784C3